MYDYHMHSRVSFDGHDAPERMVRAAREKGLKEICFTDHIDFDPDAAVQTMCFDRETYHDAYDRLCDDRVLVRKGVEFGMLPDNQAKFREILQGESYDFVLGSVHFVDGVDVYFPKYWEGKTVFQARQHFLEQTLECVRAHDDFDVLAHLTFLNKAPCNPEKHPIPYADHAPVLDEILKTLAKKEKGLEMNTSGVDRCGGFLPTAEYFLKFREFGGRIITTGSDAHTWDRVGQYCTEAGILLREIFGHVCTFEGRKVQFHKL